MSAAVQQLDELGIARAMAAGQLKSPQQYKNVLLVALRITGTGAAYRTNDKEFLWRDPANYLTQEFLQRCSGLTIILDHPEKRMLDSDSFAERVVGSIMLPYIAGKDGVETAAGNEVWGIGKIYDATTAQMIADRQLSTSPAVTLETSESQRLEDGSKLLIEGRPSLLDHVAICGLGTFDRGGPPTGVRVDNQEQLTMDSIERRIADLEARTRPIDAAARERIARDEARCDSLSQAFGLERPHLHMLSGEGELDYRSRLAAPLTKFGRLKGADLSALKDPKIFNQMLEIVFADAEHSLKHNPASVPRGTLRAVTTTNEYNQRTTKFHGDPEVCWAPFAAGVRYGRINRHPGPRS